MNARPIPRGYRGIGHETIGSDILSVLGVVQLPVQILGEELSARLRAVKSDGWYPIEWLLEALELLAVRLGPAGLRQVGRKLFQLSHEETVKQRIKNAHQLLHGFDALYHHANRGKDIGGWKVLSFGPGRAELEKTTPHHCAMEEGIMAQALAALGVPAHVYQTACMRAGADACHFVVTSSELGERWSPPAR